MSSVSSAMDEISDQRLQSQQVRDGAAVRVWLWSIAVLILAMVMLGGATRLTDSGLSITEWQPIHGVIPPLSEAAWLEEFEKYRQIPEYQLINKGMSLEAFKVIFWWEWAHRLMGRFIGLAVFVPFVFFALRGQLGRWLMPRLALLFVLGGLQGAVGWWMVASGLTERTDVSQYRLATHLLLACALFAYTVWLASRITARPRLTHKGGAHWQAIAIIALLFGQIFLGALVAGLDAGYQFNSWPLMEGQVVPSGLFVLEPWWLNAFETVKLVQFDHRVFAYLLIAAILAHVIAVWRSADLRAVRGTATLLFVACFAQVVLGIYTLLSAVPLTLGVAHQGLAVVLLGIAVSHRARFVARAPA